MHFVAALLVVCACGRIDFDSSSEVLAFTDPDAETEVESGIVAVGTCRSNLAVVLSGDIAEASATCADGAFSIPVEFTDGDGPKTVIATQPGALVTRMFHRVTPIALRASAAGFRVSAGFMVDCELTVPVPAMLRAGDLLIGAIYTDGGVTGDIAAPGFTPTTMDSATYSTFWKIATAAEPQAYTFQITAGTGPVDTCESAIVLVAFSGVSSPPILMEHWQVDSNDTTVIAPGFTAPKRGVLVGIWGANGPQTGFAQTQMTVADEAYSSGDFASVMIAYEGVQPGPTGDRKADIAVKREAVGALFLLDGKP